jgi:hypothetical protein
MTAMPGVYAGGERSIAGGCDGESDGLLPFVSAVDIGLAGRGV